MSRVLDTFESRHVDEQWRELDRARLKARRAWETAYARQQAAFAASSAAWRVYQDAEAALRNFLSPPLALPGVP